MWVRITLGLILIAAIALAVALFGGFHFLSVGVSLNMPGSATQQMGPAVTGLAYLYLVFLMSIVISAAVFVSWLLTLIIRRLLGLVRR